MSKEGTGKHQSPEIKADIIASLAMGHTQSQIAERLGVKQQYMSFMVNRDDKAIEKAVKRLKKEMVERRTTELLEPAFDIAAQDIEIEQTINNNIAKSLKVGNALTKEEISAKSVFAKTKSEILKEENIFASNINNQTNYNQFQQNNKLAIDKDVLKHLTKAYSIPHVEMNEPIEEAEVIKNG